MPYPCCLLNVTVSCEAKYKHVVLNLHVRKSKLDQFAIAKSWYRSDHLWNAKKSQILQLRSQEKLEIMIQLANDRNIDQILLEFKEYATEVDVEFVRKVGSDVVANPQMLRVYHFFFDTSLRESPQALQVVRRSAMYLG